MDERYVSITVISDPVAADQACSILEEAGMPVLIQHLEVEEDGMRASCYRVMAPLSCAQTAMKLLNLLHPVYQSGVGDAS